MNAATLSMYGVAAMTAPEFRAINGGEGTIAPPTTVGSTNLPPAGSTNAPSDKICEEGKRDGLAHLLVIVFSYLMSD